MSPEVTAAIIAAMISVLSLVFTLVSTRQQRVHEREILRLDQAAAEQRLRTELLAKRDDWMQQYQAEETRWQESFRAELRRELIEASTLEIVRTRSRLYGDVWRELKLTAGYEWRRVADKRAAVQKMANKLTEFAFSEVGLVMSDRTRRLLTSLRSACGAYIRDESTEQELIGWAHLIKHSMRSDLGIITEEYESELDRIAQRIGRVDDWKAVTEHGIAGAVPPPAGHPAAHRAPGAKNHTRD
jgi:hypothetical protein